MAQALVSLSRLVCLPRLQCEKPMSHRRLSRISWQENSVRTCGLTRQELQNLVPMCGAQSPVKLDARDLLQRREEVFSFESALFQMMYVNALEVSEMGCQSRGGVVSDLGLDLEVTMGDGTRCSRYGPLEKLVRRNVVELAVGAIALGLGYSTFINVDAAEATVSVVKEPVHLDMDMTALALGPEGPLLEEFWDNVRRYGFYFFTVVSGGIYSLFKPVVDLLKDPSTQILVLIAVIGTFYLLYLTVSTMLGITEFTYEYAQ